MKKVVLFGAGQVGAMTARLLGPDYMIVCAADNSPEKWETELAGIPVTSPENSLISAPDTFCLCVLDPEREAQMRRQLEDIGFNGEIITPASLKIFDARTATMRLIAEQINAADVPGDVAELGVYRGDFAVLLNLAFKERRLHLFDTFDGFDERDIAAERENSYSGAKAGDFGDTAKDSVDKRLFFREKAVFHKGFFPDTFKGCEDLRFAFVSIDADLYAPTAAALPLFWNRLSAGGTIMIHDYNSTQFRGVRRAVDDFCSENRIVPMPVCDMHGSAVLRKPIRMPACRQGILAGTVLAFARALGEYGATSMLIGFTPGKTATISTTVYQLWRTNDDAGALFWVMINLAISTVVLLSVNLLESRQKRIVKR